MAAQNPFRLIEHRSLPVVLRGYDRNATDELFDELKAGMMEMLSERAELNARVEELEGRLPAVEKREAEITEALLVASRVRADSEREAKQQADEQLRAAQVEAEQTVAQARSRSQVFEQEARRAEQLALRARDQLISFLESLLAAIEQREPDLESVVQELSRRASEAGGPEFGKLQPVTTPQGTEQGPLPAH
jgi:cell division septum initiation protein DivIVA